MIRNLPFLLTSSPNPTPFWVSRMMKMNVLSRRFSKQRTRISSWLPCQPQSPPTNNNSNQSRTNFCSNRKIWNSSALLYKKKTRRLRCFVTKSRKATPRFKISRRKLIHLKRPSLPLNSRSLINDRTLILCMGSSLRTNGFMRNWGNAK
jgi:hypothetical protein